MEIASALHKKAEYQAVYERGRVWAGRDLVIRTLPNSSDITRFGYSVSKSVGKAVVRNKVRRRLREITRLTPVKPGWDVVISVRPEAANADYRELKKSVEKLLSKARVARKGDEDPGAGAD